MKLNTKVNVFTTLVASIILACSFVAVYFLYKSLAVNTEFDQLQSRADDLAKAVSALETATGVDTLIRAYLPTDGYIVVEDELGSSIIRMQATSISLPAMEATDDNFDIINIGNIDHLVMSYPLLWPEVGVAYAKFVQPIPHIALNLNMLRLILITLMIISIIPIYLASNVLSRIITHPITSLTKLMQKNIENQSFDQVPIQSSSKDEIADMTKTYNNLMDELEQSYVRQQQFVGNASHELKTPLTVIESYADLLLRRGFDQKEVALEAIEAISSESKTMKALIEQMLALAKSMETMKLDITEIELFHFAGELATQMKRSFHVAIDVCGDEVVVMTDKQKLQQILFILIDNARKYSDAGSPITISVKQNASDVTLSVQDRGIGIPPEDVPHIFERFYRVTKDRNRKTGGTGLGLSIATQLADAIHAKLSAESTLGVGTTIHVTIPVSLEVSQHEN